MQSNSKLMSRLFTVLMRRTVLPGFVFPGGKVAERRVDACLEYLSLTFGTVGLERIVDFCICQVYAVSRFTPDYLLKWKLSHSFGERACVRFVTRKPGQKYYEDRWLKEHSLTREYLLGLIEDRQVHPYYRFINPTGKSIRNGVPYRRKPVIISVPLRHCFGRLFLLPAGCAVFRMPAKIEPGICTRSFTVSG